MTGPPLVVPAGAVGPGEVELFSLAGQDGQLREVNEAFARLLGSTPEQVHGLCLLQLVHPDDLPVVVAGLAQLEAGVPEVLLENRFLQSDGASVHLQWVARSLPGTGQWWAAGLDTSEFRRLLDERVDLRTRLDLALGQVTAAMWDLEVASGRFDWEPQAGQVLGVDRDGLPVDAAALAELVHPEDRTLVTRALALLVEDGAAEVTVRVGRDADVRHVSVRGKVLDRDRRDRPLRAVGLVLDVTAEKAMEEQMLRMVMSDALTGVPNRRAFDQALRTEWRRCTRGLLPLSLIMVDIDDFKRFNDTFGHLVGDEALIGVARGLGRALHRAGDVLARFGGEEFAVVLPGTDAEGALQVAEQLVAAAGAVVVRQAPGWQVTVSAGVSTWDPTGGGPDKPVQLLLLADQALYAAKAAGKDRALHASAAAATPAPAG